MSSKQLIAENKKKRKLHPEANRKVEELWRCTEVDDGEQRVEIAFMKLQLRTVGMSDIPCRDDDIEYSEPCEHEDERGISYKRLVMTFAPTVYGAADIKIEIALAVDDDRLFFSVAGCDTLLEFNDDNLGNRRCGWERDYDVLHNAPVRFWLTLSEKLGLKQAHIGAMISRFYELVAGLVLRTHRKLAAVLIEKNEDTPDLDDLRYGVDCILKQICDTVEER